MAAFVLHRLRSPLLIAIVLGFLLASITPPAFGQDVTIEQIQDEWDKRRESNQAFHFIWKGTTFHRKGSIKSTPFSATRHAAMPEVDTTTPFERSLLYDHGKIRTVHSGESLTELRDASSQYRYGVTTMTWDGQRYQSFYEIEAYHPNGNIGKDSHSMLSGTEFNWIGVAYGIEFPGSVDLAKYHIADNPANPDHIVLLHHGRNPQDYAEVWVQAKPPHLFTKGIAKVKGVPWQTTEIAYQTDPKTNQLVPHTMKHVVLDSDAVPDFIYEAEIASYNLHPKTSSADFEIKYPVGTCVVDDSVEPREHYLLREGGVKRWITDQELRRQATYEELLNSESGQAGLNRKRNKP